MKKKKLQILIRMFLVVVLSFSAIGVVFHIVMNRYMEDQLDTISAAEGLNTGWHYSFDVDPVQKNETVYVVFTNAKSDMTDMIVLFGKFMNLTLWIILSIAGCLACLMGYHIGAKAANDQQKLKYFFQNASHELKTPIMSIQGYAEGIETNVIKDHSTAAQIILGESDRMSALVDEILFLSKLDSGQVKRKKEKVDLHNLIYDCLNRIEPEAQRRQICIKAEEIPADCYCMGDENQLETVFLNILSNALRYAENRIEINCRREKRYLRIEIADDGDGIAEKDLPHIFERFYKGEGGQNGIGLSIVKEIISMHKGKIKAINENGAHFIIRLKIH